MDSTYQRNRKILPSSVLPRVSIFLTSPAPSTNRAMSLAWVESCAHFQSHFLSPGQRHALLTSAWFLKQVIYNGDEIIFRPIPNRIVCLLGSFSVSRRNGHQVVWSARIWVGSKTNYFSFKRHQVQNRQSVAGMALPQSRSFSLSASLSS